MLNKCLNPNLFVLPDAKSLNSADSYYLWKFITGRRRAGVRRTGGWGPGVPAGLRPRPGSGDRRGPAAQKPVESKSEKLKDKKP